VGTGSPLYSRIVPAFCFVFPFFCCWVNVSYEKRKSLVGEIRRFYYPMGWFGFGLVGFWFWFCGWLVDFLFDFLLGYCSWCLGWFLAWLVDFLVALEWLNLRNLVSMGTPLVDEKTKHSPILSLNLSTAWGMKRVNWLDCHWTSDRWGRKRWFYLQKWLIF